MTFLEKIQEKRGLLTILGVIGLIAVVYFAVRFGTATLFQGNIGADNEEPPPLTFDIGTDSEETQEENTDAPPEIDFVSFESEDDPEEPPVEEPEEENNNNNNSDDDDDDPEEPPADEPDEPEIEIEITDHNISPKGFNPLVSQTKLEYEISAEAEIEITIENKSGVAVVTLVNDAVLDEGEHSVVWNGTNSTTSNGKVVDPGQYSYKIRARHPDTSELKDTASGTVNLVYAVVQEDFESTPDQPEVTSTVSTTGQANTTTQSAATIAMQNTTSGTTSETGPAMAVYAIFPLLGYLLTRKKKYD